MVYKIVVGCWQYLALFVRLWLFADKNKVYFQKVWVVRCNWKKGAANGWILESWRSLSSSDEHWKRYSFPINWKSLNSYNYTMIFILESICYLYYLFDVCVVLRLKLSYLIVSCKFSICGCLMTQFCMSAYKWTYRTINR